LDIFPKGISATQLEGHMKEYQLFRSVSLRLTNEIFLKSLCITSDYLMSRKMLTKIKYNTQYTMQGRCGQIPDVRSHK